MIIIKWWVYFNYKVTHNIYILKHSNITMKKTYTSISVSKDTGFKFEKLQLDLKIKGILKTQDELINLLMDIYKKSEKKEVKKWK